MTEKREIKFRIWDVKQKRFYIPLAIPNDTYFRGVGDVCQEFVGALDKNGKEIYEGDILNTHNWDYAPYFAEVFFCERTVGFRIKNKTQKFDNFPASRYLEVVGNVFENPDLISK